MKASVTFKDKMARSGRFKLGIQVYYSKRTQDIKNSRNLTKKFSRSMIRMKTMQFKQKLHKHSCNGGWRSNYGYECRKRRKYRRLIEEGAPFLNEISQVEARCKSSSDNSGDET